MKKFFVALAVAILSLVVAVYCCFLIFPLFVKLEGYKKDIQKLVSDTSKLNLNYSKARLYTTPLLSVGLIVNDIEIKLPDNSLLLKTPEIKAGISLPSLLTLTVKTSKSHILNPDINLEIVNGEQYKVVKIVEDIINEGIKNPKEIKEPLNPFVESLINKIKIKVSNFEIKNHSLLVKDLKTNNSLNFKGEKISLWYNSRNNTFRLITNSELLLNNNKNLFLNVDFSSSLPEFKQQKQETDPDERIAIPFINIVDVYKTYDLKANVDSKLKLRTKDKQTWAYGYLNIDNLSIKLSDVILPDSYLHAKFFNKKIEYESNIYASPTEKVSFSGYYKAGKHPKIRTNVVCEKISFSNLKELLKGLLDSLNIKNNLKVIKAGGYLTANALFETNFKKIKSNGSITLKEGLFVNPEANIGIKDIMLNILLDNNRMDIKNSSLKINDSILTFKGFIDNDLNTDIEINTKNLQLRPLFNAFAPSDLKKVFILSDGSLSLDIYLKGKLNNLETNVKTELRNFIASDSKKEIFVKNQINSIDFKGKLSEINGQIKNKGFLLSYPKMSSSVKADALDIVLNNEKIIINPFDFIYNSDSSIKIKGEINNYFKTPDLNIFLSGFVNTENINRTLGKDISYYFRSKGKIPFKASLSGDYKKQNIIAQLYSDSNNFITPVNFNIFNGKPCIFSLGAKIENKKIRLFDSGFFVKKSSNFSDTLADNIKDSTKIIDIAAIVENNHLNLFRINILKELKGQIAIFKNSSFKTKGKIVLNGRFNSLNYSGNLKIWDLNIPEILFKTNLINLDFFLNKLSLNLNQINLNSSKIDASLKVNLAPSSVLQADDIYLNSDFIDVDKSIMVLDKLSKYIPNNTKQTKKTSAAAKDIPVSARGEFNIKKIKSGKIILENTMGDILFKNNNLYINKLSSKAFKGLLSGDITVNALDSKITARLKGKNIDANSMLDEAANLKDTLFGVLKFETNISLKGSTYKEQMKSLSGTVSFEVKDGQYGPFAKLENFFLAENLRENPIFKNTIGVILTPLATIDSSHFELLKGSVNFKNGIVYLNSITSQGNVLSLLVKGDFNLLSNTINSSVRARLASAVSDLLGPVAMANPVNLVKNTPGLNVATAKLFTVFTVVVDEKDFNEIPAFASSHTDENATKFQILLNGDVAKPLSLVKSFKWLALKEDIEKANEFSDNYIKEQELLAKQALIDKLQNDYEVNNKVKVGVEKILNIDTTAPEVKQLLLDEIIEANKQKALEFQKQNEEKKEQLRQEITNKVNEKLNTLEEKKQQKINELQSKIIDNIKNKNTNAIDGEVELE